MRMVLIKHNSLKSDIFFNPIFTPGFSGSRFFKVRVRVRVRFQGPGPGFRSSHTRVSLETFSIQILFLKHLYHLNSKSKENFLNIEVNGGFLLTFILRVF